MATVIGKLDWYAQRWKIEALHKVSKVRMQGRGIHDSRKASADKSERGVVFYRLAKVMAHDNQLG